MTNKELAKLKEMRKELTHTKQGNYILHKYTDEYGMVITIDDMFSIIDRYLDDLTEEHSLSEEDLIELRDRFGEEVAFVVKDMVKGNGNRWEDKISRKKLLMYLNDFALAEAPDERTPDVVKEYTAKDMQMMVYRTIQDCMRAVEEMESEK